MHSYSISAYVETIREEIKRIQDQETLLPQAHTSDIRGDGGARQARVEDARNTGDATKTANGEALKQARCATTDAIGTSYSDAVSLADSYQSPGAHGHIPTLRCGTECAHLSLLAPD